MPTKNRVELAAPAHHAGGVHLVVPLREGGGIHVHLAAVQGAHEAVVVNVPCTAIRRAPVVAETRLATMNPPMLRTSVWMTPPPLMELKGRRYSLLVAALPGERTSASTPPYPISMPCPAPPRRTSPSMVMVAWSLPVP